MLAEKREEGYYHTCGEGKYILRRFGGGMVPLFLFILIFCIRYSFYHIHTVHSSVVIRQGSSPSPHRWSVQREKPPWGAKPRIELGPVLEQAEELPTELRHTLTELRRTLN
jgi:Na+-transporting methylmalonyl-CoA/oxaloacetate decarboxylase gamma subunit